VGSNHPQARFILPNVSQGGPLYQVWVGPARQVPRVSGGAVGGTSVLGAGGSRLSGATGGPLSQVRVGPARQVPRVSGGAVGGTSMSGRPGGWVPSVRCHVWGGW
jgi:hypothetical protein